MQSKIEMDACQDKYGYYIIKNALAASDQGLHCLLTKWYIKIRLTWKLKEVAAFVGNYPI